MLYELTDVTKRYTQRRKQIDALAGIDLTIDEGEFLAIQGSTGSGKTTLLQMLGAMDRPSGGKLDFEGRDLVKMGEGDLSELRSHSFGFIFQGFNLIPTLTAQENVETALVPWHVRAGDRRRRAEEALAGVGLADRARHIPSELSGGEQQRVAIARALVRAPRVIFADEPTGNLDERTRDDIIGLLEQLWRERGQTLIVVTHDTWVASRASRRIWLDQGRLEDEHAGAGDRLGRATLPRARPWQSDPPHGPRGPARPPPPALPGATRARADSPLRAVPTKKAATAVAFGTRQSGARRAANGRALRLGGEEGAWRTQDARQRRAVKGRPNAWHGCAAESRGAQESAIPRDCPGPLG